MRPRRHCATVDFFFLPPLPLSIDLLPGIWNEPWCFPPPPPFVRPGRWVLRDRLIWFSIPPFLLLRHVTPLSPRLPPPRAPPLGDDRYLFPSHELAFLVPDRGDVSEAGWARLIKPPLDLTTVHFPPVNAPVSRRAAEGWFPPACLPPVSPRPDGWRGSRRVRPTTRPR